MPRLRRVDEDDVNCSPEPNCGSIASLRRFLPALGLALGLGLLAAAVRTVPLTSAVGADLPARNSD